MLAPDTPGLQVEVSLGQNSWDNVSLESSPMDLWDPL